MNLPRCLLALAVFGASLPGGASGADQLSRTVVHREGRVVRVLAHDGSPRDVAGPVPGGKWIEASPSTVPHRRARTGEFGASVASSGSWPMFQADAQHTGYLPVSLDPPSFSLRWQRNVGGDYVLNPVTAGDGRVFVTLLTYFNDVTTLFALRTLDGETLWSKGFGSVFSVNPPSYAYGNVYVQTGNHGSDTWLHAFEGATGATVFKAPHAAQWERYYAPTIYDGEVYVNGGYFGGMYGFDAYTGAQLWFTELPQYDQWTPAVAGGTAYAYVGEDVPGLYGEDRLTGEQTQFIADPGFDWSGWSMNLAPVIGAHDDVIVIQDGRLIGFDTALGTIRWQVPSLFAGQPSVALDRIYAIDDGDLVVLDELTHALLWSWQPPAGALTGPMIVTNKHVLASTGQAVYAVDLATHGSVWTYAVGGHLALADDTLFVASSDGTLTAFDAPGGLTPAALAVTDTTGNANGILEPAETATIDTSWRGGSTDISAVTGTSVAVGDFTLGDATASYGDIAAGVIVSCASSGDCYAVTADGTRPGTHWDVTLQETLGTGSGKDWVLHIGGSFTDMPKTSGYYRFIETLLHKGVTGGCTASTYCPTTTSSRQQMSIFTLVAKEGASYLPPVCGATPMFADVPVSSPYCKWVEELSRRGVVGGCGGGNFCPTAAVTRAQMPVFVLKTLDPTFDPAACGTTPMFGDVPVSSPYCKWIEELARRGVVSGCGGGNYCPSSPVNRAQMAVFISATFGLTLYGP
jgi:hypothetical protein